MHNVNHTIIKNGGGGGHLHGGLRYLGLIGFL